MPTRRVTRRILVPLDGSELDSATLPHLRALGSVESEILLLRVAPEPAGEPTDADRQRTAACHQQLREFAQTIRDITPYVKVIVRTGIPADEILEVAEEHQVNLIVMTSHRRSAPETIFDSVAYRVVQAATVPVMLVHEAPTPVPDMEEHVARYRRVVVPLDGSARACSAVPVAVGIAQRQNIPLHLVRCVPEEGEMTAQQIEATGKAMSHAGYESFCELMRDAIREEATIIHTSGIDAHASLLTGPPEEAIIAALSPDDILVMSSHGKGGMRPWLLGSVAQKLVSGAVANVVVVPVGERRELTRSVRERAAEAEAAAEAERATIEQMLRSVRPRYGGLPRHTTSLN